jgi:glutaredoxin
MMSIVVQILFSEGCPHTSATIELIKNMSQEMKLDIALEPIQIDDQKQARELNFLGSPTIRINGVDIDPSARSAQFSGFT